MGLEAMNEMNETFNERYMYVLFPSWTSLTNIALQPLGVFDLSLTSLTSSTYIALQP